MTNDTYITLAKLIVSVHKEMIGPYAVSQANKVPGLTVSPDGATIQINGDGKNIINTLIRQYEALFGNTSIALCKESQQQLLSKIPQDELPELLR